jgi:hypothetical protein
MQSSTMKWWGFCFLGHLKLALECPKKQKTHGEA